MASFRFGYKIYRSVFVVKFFFIHETHSPTYKMTIDFGKFKRKFNAGEKQYKRDLWGGLVFSPPLKLLYYFQMIEKYAAALIENVI